MSLRNKQFKDIRPEMSLYFRTGKDVHILRVKDVKDSRLAVLSGKYRFDVVVVEDGMEKGRTFSMEVPVEYGTQTRYQCNRPNSLGEWKDTKSWKDSWKERIFGLFRMDDDQGCLYSNINVMKDDLMEEVRKRQHELSEKRWDMEQESICLSMDLKTIQDMKELPYVKTPRKQEAPTWAEIKTIGQEVFLVDMKNLHVKTMYVHDISSEPGSREFKVCIWKPEVRDYQSGQEVGYRFDVTEQDKLNSTKVLVDKYRRVFLYTTKEQADDAVERRFRERIKKKLSIKKSSAMQIDKMVKDFERYNGKKVRIENDKYMGVTEK